jgi:hypothetical protein
MDLLGSVGLTKHGAIGLSIPAVLLQHGDSNHHTVAALGETSVPSQAMGDISVTGKATVVTYEDLGGFGLAALARITFPTGSRKSYVGEGAVTSELRVLAEYNLIAATFQATAGFKLRTAQRSFANETFGDEIPWGIGVTLFPRAIGLDKSGRFAWTVEAHGTLPAGPDAPFTNATLSPVMLGASARYRISDSFAFTAGMEGSLSGAVGLPVFRSFLGLAWTPRSDQEFGDKPAPYLRKYTFLPDEDDASEEESSYPDSDSSENPGSDGSSETNRDQHDAPNNADTIKENTNNGDVNKGVIEGEGKVQP